MNYTTDKIWCDYTYTDCSTSCLDIRNINLSFKSKDGKAAENLFERMNFIKISSVFLDSVFPAVKDTSVFVEAHKNGFKSSRKCVGKEILLDIREGSKDFCEENDVKIS
ncbi:hypothetical protein NBO_11g0033 [Nosema bombycis CQ1]|uniref:Uncharacterized protein n=1 Tax=Nosema bombycis (strain CQ1 / CVCC 102059) TaxID=578461 RepID=R0KVQ0_NOSB1|nr:hypothetical protein NBO_11g0033 [Nosema bombycis CQ1]|eukprot:EOB14961.1 hypothetical protein NBO_11g0033 [Nosema bombycis CQ1]